MEHGQCLSIAKCTGIFFFWLVGIMVAYGQEPLVQFERPGAFSAPFEVLNRAATDSVDLDGDGQADLQAACSCVDDPAVAGAEPPSDGWFRDQLIVATGVSGQAWSLSYGVGVFDTLGQPLGLGTSIPEVGATGIYVLPILHKDQLGFQAEVAAYMDLPGATFGLIGERCYYPHPTIDNLDTLYCGNQSAVELEGSLFSGFDDYLTPRDYHREWQVLDRNQAVRSTGSTFDPATLPSGTYRVQLTGDAGSNAFAASDKTGCRTVVEQTTVVRAGPPTCFGNLNYVMNESCEVVIRLGDLVPRANDSQAGYALSLQTADGRILPGNVITGADILGPVRATVLDSCSGQSCEVILNISERTPPTLTPPPAIDLSCTQDTATSTTGIAQVMDCSEVTLRYEDSIQITPCATTAKIIHRRWIATDIWGNETSADQRIAILRASVAQLRFPADVRISCSDYLAEPARIEATAEGAGRPNLIDDADCGLQYFFEDRRFDGCGPNDFSILRTWTVLDACGNQIFEVDGLGNDNQQLIRVVDEQAPAFELPELFLTADLPPATSGGSCRSQSLLPPPLNWSDCNDITSIEIITPIGEAVYVNGQDGREGGRIPAPGLEPGYHLFRYVLTDSCGNSSEQTIEAEILDVLPPIMICAGQINVSLLPDGSARLFPQNIDRGSSDYCCDDRFEMKLAEEPESAYRDFIDLFCTNRPIEIDLRLTDCSGNAATCRATVTPLDLNPVRVLSAPADRTLPCGTDYQDFLQADFEAPAFGDNCEITVDFSVDAQVDACGQGTITRRWTARDNEVNPPAEVTQVISLDTQHDLELSIPSDRSYTCTDGDDRLEIRRTGSCDELELTVSDSLLEGNLASGCYRLRRRYTIRNRCNPASLPTTIPRLDAVGGNPSGGDAYLLRIRGNELYEKQGDVERPIGTAGGGWYQYDQFIEVSDAEAPVFGSLAGLPVRFCTAEPSCLAAVDLGIDLTDNCTSGLQIQTSLTVDEEELAVDTFGTWNLLNGQLVLSGAFPVGNYRYQLLALDACGNLAQSTYAFEVEDCGTCRRDGMIDGYVLRENGLALPGVTVFLRTAGQVDSTLTDEGGYFTFSGLRLGVDYELFATKNDAIAAGLSVADIVRVQQHILAKELLRSNYQQIAGDVNNSESLTAADLLQMVRAILGKVQQFGDLPPWRFVPEDHAFPNPPDLRVDFPESVRFTPLEGPETTTLIGVKMGDVNGSFAPSNR